MAKIWMAESKWRFLVIEDEFVALNLNGSINSSSPEGTLRHNFYFYNCQLKSLTVEVFDTRLQARNIGWSHSYSSNS